MIAEIYIELEFDNSYAHFFICFSGIRLKQRVTEQLRSAGAVDVSDVQIEGLCKNLLCSKSGSTSIKYNYAFNSWKKFCFINSYTELPGSPIIVALYLSELLNSTSSYHSVSAAFYGIKWAHQMNGLIDPTDNNFVKNILESAKRTAKKPCQKKDPVTSDLIIELCDISFEDKAFYS